MYGAARVKSERKFCFVDRGCEGKLLSCAGWMMRIACNGCAEAMGMAGVCADGG
jgi:hypothetical protein